MSNTVYKVKFQRYDEDIISVISSHTRYFKDNTEMQNEISKWNQQSKRNEVQAFLIEGE